ncbi:voltage-dependent calcium channel subunit alpha-2/delta-3 isoform X2 [Condylostylus longicornis]|uniref:voltage-dependent calcium channel subunit alpha-2/delta-3 isoform X2 n=1 Tax=Condylostylus longicornis TaxID=2530218 RepID=UPI00244DB00F|nr:voltage-dependent calcium channel subunit alpha-2/delta-3 isoform X2 [Condylostylus longicornis]
MVEFKKYSIGIFIFLVIFPNFAEFYAQRTTADEIKYNAVKTWAEKLGVELWHLGDFITRRKDVQESFKQARVVARSGSKIAETIAYEIKMMMDLKVSAVRRIMDIAENTALAHQNEKLQANFSYYNAKEMLEPHEPEPTEPPIPDLEDSGVPKIKLPPKRIILTEKAEFFSTPVNTSLSSVHVPTNVFDRASEVIHAIKWSENLDETFRDNYKKDPTLSWQFFCSATGFMRQFPASKWQQDPVDLYDCRLRSWFIEAATSPKDMIILMDGSGSMTGQRLDIAKHLVNTILDTLGTNDFVNIYTFGEHVEPVVKCFQETLAQATLGNRREFKIGIEKAQTEQMANFTAALIKAFEVLEIYRTQSVGARCNQAIMIISDGAPFSYSEIFEQFNGQYPKPVRVFTYLIGKEVTDTKEIKAMACENSGFYVRLSDSAEVREKVLNYIPVMARPLVLGRHDHPVIWTEVYADSVDPKMSDWRWEIKQNDEQREDVVNVRVKGEEYFTKKEEEKRFLQKQRRNLRIYSDESDMYHFMTTVSMPVYDRRENATRIANLLGVAGIDVPIRDLKKLLMPFMLGPNGYAFIVTNNGYILVHPDFRPIFQGDILKPSYNSVDMVEVELMDDGNDPRVYSSHLIEMRDAIVNQTTGRLWLKTKYHFDEMRRATKNSRRLYFWTKIPNTPYTVVVTYPEQYGLYRIDVQGEEEIHRVITKGLSISSFFSGSNWRIHPDWIYCKHRNMTFSTKESELFYFMEKMSEPGWKWPLSRTPHPPEHTYNSAATYFNVKSNSNSGHPPTSTAYKESYTPYFCDRDLVQALAFDARVTEWFSKNISNKDNKDDKGNEFKERFGITVAFLATQSGLTRWQDFYTNNNSEYRQDYDSHFKEIKAIDEIWYKRAVEQHFIEPQSFVFSVPFNAGENPNEALVTASHAIFHSNGKESAPAAVVGFQFEHSKLNSLFRNITSSCADCTATCDSDGINCFILDNNGYIIISPNPSDIGKFFGEVNGQLMLRLVQDRVYEEVVIYDYQAICFRETNSDNGSNYLYSPLVHIIRLSKLIIKWIFWYLAQFQLVSSEMYYTDDNTTDYGLNIKEMLARVTLRRTRLMGCDQKRVLYTLNTNKDNVAFQIPASGCERQFVVYPIPGTNLILLVVDVLCPPEWAILTTNPTEIQYDTNYSLACHKTSAELTRSRPTSCINKHINESSIEFCGDATSLLVNRILVILALILFKFL